MSPEDAERWRAPRTLAGLGELTAQWLEGTIASVPTVVPGCGPDEKTAELIPVLARLRHHRLPARRGTCPRIRRAVVDSARGRWGLRRCRSRRGPPRLHGRHAPHRSRHRPRRRHGARPGNPDPGHPGRRPGNTWFGSHLDRDDIEDDQAGYGICHPDAIEALCTAWQVTIIDPEWGRNDVLWPVLKSFAAQHQA